MHFTHTKNVKENRKDLVKHIYSRISKGSVVVITDDPTATMIEIRREWDKIIAYKKIRYEEAQDFKARQKILSEIVRLQSITFSNGRMAESYGKDIISTDRENVMNCMKYCATLAVVCSLKLRELNMILAYMPRGGHINIYETEDK